MLSSQQLVSAPLNPIPTVELFRRSHPQCEHSWAFKPHANGRNIVGQQLPTLLDVTCCVRLHTLLHVGECCWELLFESGQTFEAITPNISFVPWSPKRSATMLDSFAELFPFSTPVLTLLTLHVSSQKLCGGVPKIVTKFGRTFRLIIRWRQKRSTVAS